MSYNELINAGNVKWSRAEGGGIRLDVDPLASLVLAAIDAAEVKEGGARIVGEVGSNANGSWVRFGNGLQVCWRNYQIPASVEVDVANSGWGYRSAQQDAPLPAPFIENARTFAVANINTVGYFATSGASSAASFTFHFMSGASVTVPSGAFVNLLAIGRWK